MGMGKIPGIVCRPQPASLQSAEGLLNPIREAGFTVLGPEDDANDYLYETSNYVLRADQPPERIMLPLPSTRGPIPYPFGDMKVEDLSWPSGYYSMQFRIDAGRRWDPKKKILPSMLRDNKLGNGGMFHVYPGKEGYALKFASTSFSAEVLLLGHAILHAFGIAHLEIRTDQMALDIARTQAIVEQRLLPPDSVQLREVTHGHDKLDSAAVSAVKNALGWDASIELQTLHAQVKEIHDDRVLCNEAILRNLCYLDIMETRRSGKHHYFFIDAFTSDTWNKNVFFNEDPSLRWFLLDW